MDRKKTLITLSLIYSFNVLAYAESTPKFSLNPTTPTTVSVPKNQTGKVSYLVVNNTKITRTLTMVPIPGVTSIKAKANSCAKLFTLKHKESCSLDLELVGKNLPAVINEGPVICKSQTGTNLPDPFLCSGPSQANLLHITVTPAIAPIMAFGQYEDTSSQLRPWLALSENNGINYAFPTSVTQPQLSPAFDGAGVLFSGLCRQNYCLIAGQYSGKISGVSSYRPLLGQSSDGGLTWTYPANVSQLLNVTPSADTTGNGYPKLTGTGCNSKVCISVGYYNDASNNSYPLLAQTRNQGQSWTIPANISIPPTIPGFKEGYFNTVSCNESMCIAGGTLSAQNPSAEGKPLVALTRDNGLTWTFPPAAYNPVTIPAYDRAGNYKSTACNDTICVAVGTYVPTVGGPTPILAITKNGVNWTYPTSITQPNLNPTFDGEGTLDKVSCSNKVCIAGGVYQTNIGLPLTKRPLVAVSRDNGSTWQYSEQFSQPQLSPEFEGPGNVNDVSCFNELCVVVGSYTPGSRPHPFLAVSQNAGVSWTFHPEISNLAVSTTATAENGRLVGVSCNADICLASGVYTDDNGRYPYIAQSKDKGLTWTYPTSVQSPTLTPAPAVDGADFRGAAAGSK